MIEIPDYEIKDPLGEGGMATVYHAIHKRLQREVALKIMAPSVSSTKAFQKSFFVEARTVAKLEHLNIVKIYDIDSHNGHFYMSMELLCKDTLKERLADNKLPLSTSLHITKQMADALNYAHQKGYIHRDIKPANIMFRKDGNTVLTDFGIAKIQGTTGEMTQMGYIVGTPHYMAPEQATGNNEIDQRADIYSLGVVFYEMLTGNKPFSGSNTVAITYEHVHGAIPKLQGENAAFQTVINKALAKNPEDRYESIQNFSKALFDASQSLDKTQIMQPNAFSEDETLIMEPSLSSKLNSKNKRQIWPWLILFLICSVFGVLATNYYKNKKTEEKQFALDLKNKQQKLDDERKNKELLQKLAMQKSAKEAIELKQKNEFAQEKMLIKTEKINSHISLAIIRDEKRRIYDHSDWSEGCRLYLEDVDGPYDPKDTSEWHLQKVLTMDENNDAALSAMEKINKRKRLEFSNCDNYQRQVEEDPLKDLFKD